MPFAYCISPEYRLGVVVVRGSITAADLRRAMGALFLDDRWRPAYRALWDARQIEKLVVDFARICIASLRPWISPSLSRWE